MAVGPNAITFEGLGNQGLLPKPIVGEIFKQATHDSVALRVAGTTPMPITGGTTVMQTGDIVAGVVNPGEHKPVVSSGTTTKSFAPIKVAAIMYWDEESRIANPLGFLDVLQESASSAITKAIDLAIIHGKDGLSGATIPGVEYLAQTANSVELGTAATTAGGLTADVTAGYDAVVNAGGDYNGFIADPRLRSQLINAVDAQGRPVYQSEVDLRAGMGNFLGLPVAYGKAVGGNIGQVGEQNIRAIGGDFQGNLKVGFVEQIKYKRTDTASIMDGDVRVDLWQQNMEAYLVEAIFGWVIKDVNGFAKYTVAAPGA